MEQRGAFAHRLQFLGHPRKPVRRFAQVQAVVLADPGEFELRHLAQRIAIGRDEPAQHDRLTADPCDIPAQFIDVAPVKHAFAIVELVTQIGDLGIKLDRDRMRQRGNEIASVDDPSAARRGLDLAQRRHAVPADRGDPVVFDPHPDRNQPVAVLHGVGGRAAQVDQHAGIDRIAARARLARDQRIGRHVRHVIGNVHLLPLARAIDMQPDEPRPGKVRDGFGADFSDGAGIDQQGAHGERVGLIVHRCRC